MAARSAYKSAYCNDLIACLAKGHSVTGFAGSIGVGRRTVFDWLGKHAEFAEAYEVAKAKAAFFWEKRVIDLSLTGEGNPAATIFGIKNRASEDWRDVQKIETGKPGEFDGLDAADQDRILAAINEELARREDQTAANPKQEPPKPVSSLH